MFEYFFEALGAEAKIGLSLQPNRLYEFDQVNLV
jgi:hypothetical protein